MKLNRLYCLVLIVLVLNLPIVVVQDSMGDTVTSWKTRSSEDPISGQNEVVSRLSAYKVSGTNGAEIIFQRSSGVVTAWVVWSKQQRDILPNGSAELVKIAVKVGDREAKILGWLPTDDWKTGVSFDPNSTGMSVLRFTNSMLNNYAKVDLDWSAKDLIRMLKGSKSLILQGYATDGSKMNAWFDTQGATNALSQISR